jgi:hypothetical protein
VGGVVTNTDHPDEEFATLPSLLRRLGYDVTDGAGISNELEDYAESYLYHDAYVNLMDWIENESGESVTLDAEGVVMWNLDFPVTLEQFHDYLDELDLRIGRIRIIGDVPAPDDEDDDEAGKICSAMALVFGVDAQRVHDDLGTSWTSINSDAVGYHSNPVAYVSWADHIVVGLDDQYVYAFLTTVGGDVLDANTGGVIWEGEWTKDGVADYAGFARTLRESTTGMRKLSTPKVWSGRVTPTPTPTPTTNAAD